MARTDADAVKLVLLDDYGPKEDGTEPSLTPFITAASLIIDRVATCSTAKGDPHSVAELLVLETWLAAHLYGQADQPYSSRSTSGASGQFQGQTGMSLDSTKYGQTAAGMDHSGCLRAHFEKRTARMDWLGVGQDEQLNYDEWN